MTFGEWAALGILAVNGVQDLRRKEILVLPTAAAGIAGFFWRLFLEKNSLPVMIWSVVPGLLLICLSRLTGGKLGMGDGFIVCASGIWTGFFEILRITVWGFLGAAAVGSCLLLKKSGKKEMPFVPFLLAAFLAERLLG